MEAQTDGLLSLSYLLAALRPMAPAHVDDPICSHRAELHLRSQRLRLLQYARYRTFLGPALPHPRASREREIEADDSSFLFLLTELGNERPRQGLDGSRCRDLG
jgi:hypothetical protein